MMTGKPQSQTEARFGLCIDFDPKKIDLKLLLALKTSGVLYGGLRCLFENAEFGT